MKKVLTHTFFIYNECKHAGVPNSFSRGLQLYRLICQRLIPNFSDPVFLGGKNN